MPIKAVYDKLDDIPEQYRDLFGERGGKFELVGVEGVKTQADVERLQSALAKERGEHKTTKEALAVWGDLKPDEVRSSLDRLPELEALLKGDKIDQERIDEIVEARIRSRIAPVERERDQLKQQSTELSNQVAQFKETDRVRTIREAVAQAARKAKIVDTALDDAIALGERVFDVQDGKVLVKDDAGFTPGVDPSVWFNDIQEKRPHWWPPSQGGGSAGSLGNGAGMGRNPWSSDNWNMTEQGRVMREKGIETANQLAKQAGTSVGGPRPFAKK